MQPRLTVVTLGVADLARSRRFYRDGLNLEPTLDLDEVVFFQVNHGLLLALFPLESLSADAGVPATPGSSVSLGWNVDTVADVARAVELARDAGATVLKEAQRADWGGTHAYVADPDGHRWEIVHNPGLVVTGDGRVTLGPVEPEQRATDDGARRERTDDVWSVGGWQPNSGTITRCDRCERLMRLGSLKVVRADGDVRLLCERCAAEADAAPA